MPGPPLHGAAVGMPLSVSQKPPGLLGDGGANVMGDVGHSIMQIHSSLVGGVVQRVLKPSGSAIGKKRDPNPMTMGRRQQRNVLCVHNRRKQNCLECGTAILCPHSKRKAYCRECSTAYCKHNRLKQHCRDCGGSRICPHGRVKHKCRDCGGSMFCKHNRAKRNCKEGCGGTNICKHSSYKNRCKKCKFDSMCVHKIERKHCADCKPLREVDAAGMAVKMHELIALLEREHFPFPAHPRRAEINAALTGYKTLALAHAPATPAPPLPPPEAMGIERSPAMTLQSVSDALSSSNVSLLTPALRELARMADNNEVEDLEPCITQVSSKRILGHADFTVRAAAVAALSALVKSDEAATRAAMRKPPVFDQPSDSAGGGPEKHTARKNKEKEQEKKDMESQLYTEFISTQYYYYLEHMDHEPGAKPKRRRSTKESQGQADVPGAQVSVTTGAAAGALNDNGELGAGASASTEVAHTQVPDAPRPTPPAIAQQPIDTRLSVNSRLAGPVRGAGAGDEREAESATSGAGHVAGGKGEGLEAETQASMSAVELEKMKTVHFMMYQHIQLLQQHIREMQDHIQPEKQRKRHNNKSTLLTPAPLLTPGTACSGVGSTSIKNTAKRDSSAADGGGEREGGGYQGRSGVQADGGEAQKDNENGGGSGSAGKRADDGQAIGAGQPPQQRQVQDQRTVCRFGTECRNPKCKFTHPPGVGEVSWKQHEARIQGDPNWMNAGKAISVKEGKKQSLPEDSGMMGFASELVANGASATKRNVQKLNLATNLTVPLDWDWAKGCSVPGILKKPALPILKTTSSRKRSQATRDMGYQKGLADAMNLLRSGILSQEEFDNERALLERTVGDARATNGGTQRGAGAGAGGGGGKERGGEEVCTKGADGEEVENLSGCREAVGQI